MSAEYEANLRAAIGDLTEECQTLRHQIAEAQALLKVTDDAIRWYIESCNTKLVTHEFLISHFQKALAQTSGTDALDKMLEAEHKVGDCGQRYEVSFFDPTKNARMVYGWTNDHAAAIQMSDCIEKHPSWQFGWITDRYAVVKPLNRNPSNQRRVR